VIKAVLDTSVIAAAFLKPGGINHRVLREAGRRYKLYLCRHILEELERVLRYPRIRSRYPHSEEELEKFIQAVKGLAERIYKRCPKVDVIAEDPADNEILGCRLTAKADYIVSKDLHLLALRKFQGMRIVRSDEFLSIIGRQRGLHRTGT
jgi:putative PIN family toxin of toxin-antitoxin system